MVPLGCCVDARNELAKQPAVECVAVLDRLTDRWACQNLIMEITAAQADVRRVYRHGAVGQVVTALVWAVSAIIAARGIPGGAPLALFLGGMLIFPLTTLGLRLLGGPVALPAGHPMSALAFQTAMQVPLGLLVALVLASFDENFFFPAAMVLVGAHYLPFVFLYGMRLFLLLAIPMVVAGICIAIFLPSFSVIGAWFTVTLLLLFAIGAFAHDRRSTLLLQSR